MITIWGRKNCGPCLAVKGALRLKGIAYVERDLADATAGDWERWGALQGSSAPVVEHAGGVFAGFVPAKVQALIDAN